MIVRTWLIAASSAIIAAAQISSVSAGQAGSAAAQQATLDEVFAGFRYNASLFISPRISWRLIARKGVGWYKLSEKRAADLDRLANAIGITDQQRNDYKRRAEATRQGAKTSPSEEFWWQDFWTDRSRFQVRSPVEQLDSFAFPDEAVTPESLSATYAAIRILSFKPEGEYSYRLWNGPGRRDGGLIRSASMIGNDTAEKLVQGFRFPPLVLPDSHWGPEAIWHPIDQLLSIPTNAWTIKGTENYKGVSTEVIEHLELKEAPSGFARASGHFQIARVTRAWIDAKQGFLPLRITFHDDVLRDGRSIFEAPGVPVEPSRELVVSSIERIDGAGFYPTVSRLIGYSEDPGANGRNTVDDFLAGKRVQTHRLIDGDEVFEVKRVTPHAEMSAAMFALEFPNQTAYLDANTRKYHVIGMSDEESAPLFRRASPDDDEQSVNWRVIRAVMNIALVMIVGGFLVLIIRRRRMMRRTRQ